ncbi:MAG: SET domain-containing protein [Leptolyngbyaceae cyanobacterium RM1_406_9]|nr:SET domain-containing protein [Leptolyngbyaceae cyanobacterium RM1_406_9]
MKLDKVAEMINHSCDPNLRICNNSLGGYNFHAIRTIEAGEELTWDYAMSESQSIAVEKCLCGVPQCRGKSVGFTDLPLEEQQILHSKGVAHYLSEWHIQQLTQTILHQS